VFAWLSVAQTGAALGVGLTAFAVAVHILERSHSTLAFGVASALGIVPSVLLAPAAGVLVDRWGATRALVVAGLSAAGCSAALAALLATGSDAPVPIGLLLAATAACVALQWPAWVKASTALVEPAQLGRASGWMQLGQAAQHVGSPAVAALLLIQLPPWGVVVCDAGLALASAGVALALALPPDPPARALAFAQELAGGWRWIRERRPLWAWQWYFAASFGTGAFLMLLSRPLLLSMSGVEAMGGALTAGGLGMVVGAVAAGLWGGPRRRATAILWIDGSASVWMLLTALAPSPALVAVTCFLFLVQYALANSLHQAMWQAQVPVEAQGRVFGVRRMVMWAGIPAGYVVAGAMSQWWDVRVVLALAAGARGLGCVIGAAWVPALRQADHMASAAGGVASAADGVAASVGDAAID